MAVVVAVAAVQPQPRGFVVVYTFFAKNASGGQREIEIPEIREVAGTPD